jgi:hypothetical protein
MQDPGDLRSYRSLLVAVCHREAKQALDPALVERLDDEGFRRGFLDLASRHGVTGLTLSVITRALAARGHNGSGIPDLDDHLRAVRRRAAMFDMKRDHVVGALLSADVQPVILKGAAIALTCYAEPFERDFGDLDILVPEDRVEQSLRALGAGGYVGPPSPEELQAYRRHHFHVPLSDRDAHVVEIHWALTRQGASFQLDANEVLAQSASLERPGQPGLILPRPEHTLLHLVIQNLQEGFSRLSRPVDMDRIVVSTPGLDWDTLVATAGKGDLASATAVSLRLANLLLGTPVPNGVLQELRPGPVARFHVAIMRPVQCMLDQRLQNTHAAKNLYELWLLGGVRKRILRLWQMLTPHPVVTLLRKERPGALRRLWRLGKMFALQLCLYLAAAVTQATPSGRARMRFW